MSLFTTFEERLPLCRAVPVDYDTIEDIACYFAVGNRYETCVSREGRRWTLRINHSEKQEPFELVVRIGFDDNGKPYPPMVLIYGLPPALVYASEFQARWRRIDDGAEK